MVMAFLSWLTASWQYAAIRIAKGGHCAWVECFTIVGHACCDLNSEYRMSYNLDNIMSLKYD